MKRLIIVALAFAGFSASSFAQAVPVVKKNEPTRVQVVKKQTDTKAPSKVVALNKVKAPTAKPVSMPVVTIKTHAKQEKKTVVKTKVTPSKEEVKTVPSAKPIVNAINHVPLKKDGTPDKRFKAHTGVASGPLKKDGTPDMRYKANKKNK